MTLSSLISAALVLGVSTLLVLTGMKKQPGLGILVVLVIIPLALWFRGEHIRSLGFGAPSNWWLTMLLGLALGTAIQLLGVAVIEPLSEKITGARHDLSIVDNVRGNWKAFVQWILLVWVFVPILEEGIYRGFLMTETARFIGTGVGASIVNVLFSSLVFGLSHGYQGRAGIVSTSLVGIFLGLIFIGSGFNLWLAIFTHGFIDTIGIALIALDGDKAIRRKIWGARDQGPES
jgi:uncharacterized protein